MDRLCVPSVILSGTGRGRVQEAECMSTKHIRSSINGSLLCNIYGNIKTNSRVTGTVQVISEVHRLTRDTVRSSSPGPRQRRFTADHKLLNS